MAMQIENSSLTIQNNRPLSENNNYPNRSNQIRIFYEKRTYSKYKEIFMQAGLYLLGIGISSLLYQVVHIKTPQLGSCFIELACSFGLIIGVYLLRERYETLPISFPLSKRNEEDSSIINGNFFLLKGSNNLPIPETLNGDISPSGKNCLTITVAGTTAAGRMYSRNLQERTSQIISDKRRRYFASFCAVVSIKYLLSIIFHNTDDNNYLNVDKRDKIEIYVTVALCALSLCAARYYYRYKEEEYLSLEEAPTVQDFETSQNTPNNPQETTYNKEPRMKVIVKKQCWSS